MDIGSNSIKCLIAEWQDRTHFNCIYDDYAVTRIGELSHQTKTLIEPAMERSRLAIKKFLTIAKAYHVQSVIAVATMALRVATNAQTFIHRIKSETGISIKILSGDDEAKLSYQGAISTLPIHDNDYSLVFDNGGGSTELIVGKGKDILEVKSLPLGAVMMMQTFFQDNPVSISAISDADQYIKETLNQFDCDYPFKLLIGIGGTSTTMGAVNLKLHTYAPHLIHGSVLTSNEVNRQISLYHSMTIEQRKTIQGLSPDRADIILPGACVVRQIIKKCQLNQLTISDQGLRHGVFFSSFESQ